MIGTRLAHYEITAHLGSGGMGDVFQATDTKLGRSVAIKFLPEAFTHDSERLARFQREARVLASLNHPNIAAIYGVEEVDGRHFLVMELVTGETLEERIRRGPIPIREALPIAKQIAEALEEAHEAGIVHRDLKPANIKVTAHDKVKVLDFGLAKAELLEQADGSVSNSPTMTMAATNEGVILGTAGYMAPEQARGKPVDRRADIWAFGVVLFKMLSGSSVFEGETVTDTLAKILERDPDWSQLPATTSAALRKLLRRCLTKNPRNRLQAIGDARTFLEELIEGPEQEEVASVREVAPYPSWKKVLPWVAAALALVLGLLLRTPSPPSDQALLQFEYPLPPGLSLNHNNRHAVEISPDGHRVAYIAGDSSANGDRRIYVRNLDLQEDIAIPGTDGAQNLFFSENGEWLGFQQGQRIKKVSLAGGMPSVVVENLNAQPSADWGPPGITWGQNGMIVYPPNLGSGLSMVRDTGGEPEAFTELDTEAHEASHRLPHFLPGANGVLFTVLRYSAVTPDWARAQVWVKSLKDGTRKLLIENALDARYAGNNTLVFSRQGKLFAVRFDPDALSVSGDATQVLDGVVQSLYGIGAIAWTAATQFSIAQNGALFYAPGSVEPPLLSSLVWADRKGNLTPVEGMRTPMFRFAARILPDDVRLTFSELYANKDIRVFDTVRGTEDRITFEGQNAYPIWTPDGSRVAFRSDRAGPMQIYLSDGSNTREVQKLTDGPFDVPSSWTPDGKELLFTRGTASMGGDTNIYAVSVDPPGEPRPILNSAADERFPEVSPDGKWLAYCANDSGRWELYVQPYPGPGARVTLTNGGAQDPAWSKSGNEIFYRVGSVTMAVPFVVSGESFVPGKAVPLFEQFSLGGGATVRGTYDVDRKGRFLLNQPIGTVAQERTLRIFPKALRFVLNWTQSIQPLLDQD